MFLDIQMPGMTGLVAHQAQGRCHIVFVTAYDAYAVAAFETGALDYVLKPLERERLRLAVDRVSQRLGSTPQNLEGLLRDGVSIAFMACSRVHNRGSLPAPPGSHLPAAGLDPRKGRCARRGCIVGSDSPPGCGRSGESGWVGKDRRFVRAQRFAATMDRIRSGREIRFVASAFSDSSG